jgi:hypothetical protein
MGSAKAKTPGGQVCWPWYLKLYTLSVLLRHLVLNHSAIYLLLVFTIFEVLEGPIREGNELETSNCNLRHNEPCKNITQHRDMCWCNSLRGSIFGTVMVLPYLLTCSALCNTKYPKMSLYSGFTGIISDQPRCPCS